MQAIRISIYLAALVFANFIVVWFGKTGLIFTALFLIPFDFVIRCIFHETWKGMELVLKLGALTLSASIITYLINADSINIAAGSSLGFIAAQIVAGIFYQWTINKPYWLKVNGSDFIGILTDSIVFQIVAFSAIDSSITLSQTVLKLVGGVFWYWLIFVKLKLHKRWL
jgi:uncharacterized PurR-regulated membrane protein YhhQ (DUF165 family)